MAASISFLDREQPSLSQGGVLRRIHRLPAALRDTRRASSASDTIPRYSLDALRNFAGTQVPEQRPPTLSRRLLDFLKSRF
jgi:hypothetical protein